MPETIVCLGDSITRGLVSANYVHLLERRLDGSSACFINAGINNDLTYNMLQRIDRVIDAKPDVVTILAGTNDVIASLGPDKAAFFAAAKRLPQYPKLEWAWHNLLEIIHQLKTHTHARIGLLSIPLLGENPLTTPARRVQKYNTGLKHIAYSERVHYLPLYEALLKELQDAGIVVGKAYTGSTMRTLEFAFRRLFGEDYDEFSLRHGFTLTVDGVHLNNVGARVAADLIERFLLEKTA